MNAVLAFVVLMLVCGALCTRLTPRLMLEAAAWLRATAEADMERRATHARLRRMYRQEYGLPVKDNVLQLPEATEVGLAR